MRSDYEHKLQQRTLEVRKNLMPGMKPTLYKLMRFVSESLPEKYASLAIRKEEITEKEKEITRVILLLGIWLNWNHVLSGITFT